MLVSLRVVADWCYCALLLRVVECCCGPLSLSVARVRCCWLLVSLLYGVECFLFCFFLCGLLWLVAACCNCVVYLLFMLFVFVVVIV